MIWSEDKINSKAFPRRFPPFIDLENPSDLSICIIICGEPYINNYFQIVAAIIEIGMSRKEK